MKLCDVNVLIYAHREDASPEHPAYADWLRRLVAGPSAFGVSEAVLGGFVRIVTNPKVFKEPTPTDMALRFCQNLLDSPQACVLRPGDRNWMIFQSLCRTANLRGKLVADAWHAALAIEYDCEWISTDADFSRFEGLRWRHPLKTGA
ncbi:MAG TPA: type II toxin-antitoxin system VapC family toxin [Alphaproteobacteria bacterium]|jgi:toxin-antitoxin system PIN domain toxin|nr:type II toxin-antitoxin system VapC family toxin [Alphaproteobacteria bacterium]